MTEVLYLGLGDLKHSKIIGEVHRLSSSSSSSRIIIFLVIVLLLYCFVGVIGDESTNSENCSLYFTFGKIKLSRLCLLPWE